MTQTLRIVILIVGFLFAGYVFFLLFTKKLTEKNSIIWLLWTFIALIFSIFPGFLSHLSIMFGVDYPPTLLFFCTIILLMFILLHHSIQISKLTEQIRELTQQYAVKELIDTKKE
jgi:hypothetical protein